MRTLPDGCVDIMFSFGNTPSQNSMKQYCPYIIGTNTSFSELFFEGKVTMLGIRFKPGGITAFTRIPVYDLTDRHEDLTLVETIFDERFYGCLPECKTLQDKIKHIDCYLTGRLSSSYIPPKEILYAVQLIEQTRGILPLSEILKSIYLCQRHFDRKFKCAIGLSPKAFSKIIRFKNTLNFIQNNPTDSLFSVALDCGYFDHAHLTREFKVLSGFLPTHFRI